MNVRLYMMPHDTLFFRDSRPFGAGQGASSESVLPSPLTIYGSIGSYLLDINGITLSKFIDESNKGHDSPLVGRYSEELVNGGFKLKGPFFAIGKEVYFPAPANLWVSGANRNTGHFLRPDPEKSINCDIGGLSPLSIDKVEYPNRIEPFSGWLSLSEIKKYLLADEGTNTLSGIRYESDFFDREQKTGQCINDESLTVKDGMLYSATHLRFRKKIARVDFEDSYTCASLLVVVAGTGINESVFRSKTYCLGGERRPVDLALEEEDDTLVELPAEVLKKIKETRNFFVYLATPAIFEYGWSKNWSNVFNSGVKLVGAAVKKPGYISGWKRSGAGAGGGPRHIKRLVPEGSVYFFEAQRCSDADIEKICEKYHFNESLSDEYPDAGFGIALIGAW